MTKLKLYRGTDCIGIVTNPEQEGPETTAALEFTPAASKWKDLLDYIMSDLDTTDDPPAALNAFEDWYLEDENGFKRAIFVPGIYDGGTNLAWRWKR
jgi:hypothetical protein